MEIKWNDIDPDTGERRYLCAERFAGIWRFRWKLQRRGDWTHGLEPTQAMWEHVLDTLQRRYRRREGVDDPDIAQVAKIVKDLRSRAVQLERINNPASSGKRSAAAGGFTAAETTACQRLVDLAIEEDIGPGDVTSQAVIAADLVGRAVFVARSPGILAGLPCAELVIRTVDSELRFERLLTDGVRLEAGQRLARVVGPMRSILAAERIALNFLQHLSGVASLTRKYVDAVTGSEARILDTRKTLPGYRLMQKYAVRCGGGLNHRMGLFDGILIKDNHLAALSIPEAVRRSQAESTLPVEIEVDNLDQLDVALICRPSIILLDNMDLETMSEAVRRRDDQAPGVQIEVLERRNLQTVRAIAETGVDRISIGALTHSAPALDIALDFER